MKIKITQTIISICIRLLPFPAPDEQNNRRPSQVYGSAHLLRLMVKIGGLLSKFPIGKTDEENPNQLIEATLIDLLNYLEANRSNLFLSKNYSALESSD